MSQPESKDMTRTDVPQEKSDLTKTGSKPMQPLSDDSNSSYWNRTAIIWAGLLLICMAAFYQYFPWSNLHPATTSNTLKTYSVRAKALQQQDTYLNTPVVYKLLEDLLFEGDPEQNLPFTLIISPRFFELYPGLFAYEFELKPLLLVKKEHCVSPEGEMLRLPKYPVPLLAYDVRLKRWLACPQISDDYN